MAVRRLVVVWAVLALLCMLSTAAAWVLRPPRLTTHAAVVQYLIERRQLKVERVDAALPWPEGVNYYAYGPSVYPYNLNVTIQLQDGTRMAGKIECRNDQYDCQVTIAALQIDRLDMPDISTGQNDALPQWLRTLAARFGVAF
jgi:hypothetical protein